MARRPNYNLNNKYKRDPDPECTRVFRKPIPGFWEKVFYYLRLKKQSIASKNDDITQGSAIGNTVDTMEQLVFRYILKKIWYQH